MIDHDLHCHTHFSDGTLSPQALIDLAQIREIKALAVTDHDSILSYPPLKEAVKGTDIQLIPGVEISTKWEGISVHIVGLGFDPSHPGIVKPLEDLMALREKRYRRMLAIFQQVGMRDVAEKTQAIMGEGVAGRLHFARALVECGHAKSVNKAFSRFLHKGKMAYVAMAWPTIEEAICWIKSAGGYAVLAHPLRYKLTRTKLQKLLKQFKAAEGDAVEVVTGSHSPEEIQTMAEFANRYDFYASQGSDYHGPGVGHVELGVLRPMPSMCRPLIEILL